MCSGAEHSQIHWPLVVYRITCSAPLAGRRRTRLTFQNLISRWSLSIVQSNECRSEERIRWPAISNDLFQSEEIIYRSKVYKLYPEVPSRSRNTCSACGTHSCKTITVSPTNSSWARALFWSSVHDENLYKKNTFLHCTTKGFYTNFSGFHQIFMVSALNAPISELKRSWGIACCPWSISSVFCGEHNYFSTIGNLWIIMISRPC